MWESDEESDSADANDTDDQLVQRKRKGNRATKRGINSMPRNMKRA